jgi:hypothetical protein
MSSYPSVVIGVLLSAALGVNAAAQQALPVHASVGPLEQRAKPSSPENPIPRRTAFTAPVTPPAWRQPGGGDVTVRLRVTLNTAGRVGEIRLLEKPLSMRDAATPADVSARIRMSGALVASAAEALRHWAYDAPAAPISFVVLFTFSSSLEPTAVQRDPQPDDPRGPPPLVDDVIRR